MVSLKYAFPILTSLQKSRGSELIWGPSVYNIFITCKFRRSSYVWHWGVEREDEIDGLVPRGARLEKKMKENEINTYIYIYYNDK